MEFLVTIEKFNGPLDLMLHLIKENKLDLLDLDLNVLATQYIQYINAMQTMHLEVASEYLSELASLIEYKSKKLLPRETVEVQEDYEEDQRDKLVARLIEYQRYKEAADHLKEQFTKRNLHFSRPISTLVDEWMVPVESPTLPKQSTYELTKAMNRVIHRFTLLQPYETQVTIKELSVEERIDQLKQKWNGIKETSVSFEELCQDCLSYHMVIVTFLAILDLIHQKYLQFTIDEKDTIWLQRSLTS